MGKLGFRFEAAFQIALLTTSLNFLMSLSFLSIMPPFISGRGWLAICAERSLLVGLSAHSPTHPCPLPETTLLSTVQLVFLHFLMLRLPEFPYHGRVFASEFMAIQKVLSGGMLSQALDRSLLADKCCPTVNYQCTHPFRLQPNSNPEGIKPNISIVWQSRIEL